jgi:hypothetical protein
MPNQDNYEWDVFISYRRLSRVKEWVRDYFIKALTDSLEMELGVPPKIFWDEEGVEAGNRFTPTILNALKKSRCLICLWVKPYFQSPWCIAEWKTFVERAQRVNMDARGLTVPIRLRDSEEYTEEFKPLDFTEFNTTAPHWVQTEKYMSFQSAIDKLAERIVEIINSAPDFDLNWEVIHPDTITIDSKAFEGWAFHLKEPHIG